VTIIMCYVLLGISMSELSEHTCPRCELGLYIETSQEAQGVDLLICKGCWGVAVAAKSMDSVISNGNKLDELNDESYVGSGCNCPICSTEMKEIELDIPEEVGAKLSLIDASAPKKVIIDSCENCPTFWFDAGELDLLNGIKPKVRNPESYDSKSNRLLDDQTLTEEDIKQKMMIRRLSGLGVLIIGFRLATLSGIIIPAGGVILGIGGLIAVVSSNPDKFLNKGTCDKCLKENKSLAWNCQSGGCWAHICTDCQTIGSDPVEAYAKTLGKVAVGTVVVGVGVLAIFAIAEGGGAIGGSGLDLLPSKSEKNKEKENERFKGLLLCQKCTRDAGKHEDVEAQIETIEDGNYSDSEEDGYCTHIDPLNGKKCKRVQFRNMGLCYVHK